VNLTSWLMEILDFLSKDSSQRCQQVDLLMMMLESLRDHHHVDALLEDRDTKDLLHLVEDHNMQ